MSYTGKPRLGIGTGIGNQAMAGLTDYLLLPPPPPPPAQKLKLGRRRQAFYQPTGACCAGCTSGATCGARDALGSSVILGQVKAASSIPIAPTAPPFVGGGGGTSPIVKILVLGGLVAGGVFVYRKIKNRKRA